MRYDHGHLINNIRDRFHKRVNLRGIHTAFIDNEPKKINDVSRKVHKVERQNHLLEFDEQLYRSFKGSAQ